MVTLLGINISPTKAFLKMSFLFPQVGYLNSLVVNNLLIRPAIFFLGGGLAFGGGWAP